MINRQPTVEYKIPCPWYSTNSICQNKLSTTFAICCGGVLKRGTFPVTIRNIKKFPLPLLVLCEGLCARSPTTILRLTCYPLSSCLLVNQHTCHRTTPTRARDWTIARFVLTSSNYETPAKEINKKPGKPGFFYNIVLAINPLRLSFQSDTNLT